MTSEGMNEESFYAKCDACVREDRAMNTFVSALVSSFEYERFIELVREYVADEAAMDVVEDVLGGEEDLKDTLDDEEGAKGRNGCGEDEDFSAFV